MLAQRGSADAVLPPPMQRAVLRGEAVAGTLRLLLQVRRGVADQPLVGWLACKWNSSMHPATWLP